MTINHKILIRRQLDRKITAIKSIESSLAVPKAGWLKTIREAIGMTAQQAVKNLHNKETKYQQLFHKMEASEQKGTISINSLRKYASAINCKVVYAIIPNTASLDELVLQRARLVAEKIIMRTQHTMELENQGINNQETLKQIEETVLDLVLNLRSDIWDD